MAISDNTGSGKDALRSESEFLERIGDVAGTLDASAEKDLHLLAKTVGMRSDAAAALTRPRALRRKPFRRPVVIVAGGTDADAERVVAAYRACVVRGFQGFTGTILSGGTTAGISGIVGNVAEALRTGSASDVDIVGYLPGALSTPGCADSRYTELFATDDSEFSPHQPMQAWIDLRAAGVDPSEVVILGINGGSISAFEYRLALALGASLGLIDSSGGAAADLLAEEDAWEQGTMLRLPRDAMTIRAFVNLHRSLDDAASPDVIEQTAKATHARFLAEGRRDLSDPVMAPWDALRDDLKESNRDQARQAMALLRRAGYAVRPAAGEAVTEFPPEHIEFMAEMEHGRWNVERLRAGWRYGPQRDSANRITPYLVAWSDLPDDIKEYDRAAVRNWPAVFKAAGLAIFPI